MGVPYYDIKIIMKHSSSILKLIVTSFVEPLTKIISISHHKSGDQLVNIFTKIVFG